METLSHYKGYYIKADILQVSNGDENTGKYMADEYYIGRDFGNENTEKQFVHNTHFSSTKEEAIQITLLLARETIDRIENGLIDL
jgi:hypothetical protein